MRLFGKFAAALFALLMILGLTLGFAGIHDWYFLLAIGAWGASAVWSGRPMRGKDYWLLFLLGCAIELLGRYLLHLWQYPFIASLWMEVLLMLFYPFILASFVNTYSILRKKFTIVFSVVAAMAIGIVLWELPNLASQDWIYAVPWWIWAPGWLLLIVPPVYTLGHKF